MGALTCHLFLHNVHTILFYIYTMLHRLSTKLYNMYTMLYNVGRQQQAKTRVAERRDPPVHPWIHHGFNGGSCMGI